MRSHWQSGYLQVILSGIGFGFLGYFLKLGLSTGLTVEEILTYRFIIATLILWVFVLLRKPKLIFLEKKQILYSLLLGSLGYTIFSTLYFKSLEGLSLAVAAMLLFTFPLFVNIGERIFLKRHLGSWQWISLTLALMGMVVLLWGYFMIKHSVYIFFGLGAALSYSVYVIVSAQVQKSVEPLSSSLYVIAGAALMFTLVHQPDFSRLPGLPAGPWLVLLGIATISTIGPLTLFLSGLQRLSGSKASVIVMIEPITAALIGYTLLGEELKWTQVLGTLIILTALVLNAKKARSPS